MCPPGITFQPAALNRCSERLLVLAPAVAMRLMKMCEARSLSLKLRVLSVLNTNTVGILHLKQREDVDKNSSSHNEAVQRCVGIQCFKWAIQLFNLLVNLCSYPQ